MMVDFLMVVCINPKPVSALGCSALQQLKLCPFPGFFLTEIVIGSWFSSFLYLVALLQQVPPPMMLYSFGCSEATVQVSRHVLDLSLMHAAPPPI
jgi:hypothetical protein